MRVVLVALLMMAIGLSGCTDDGGGDAGGTMPAGESQAQTHAIAIEDFAFSESSLTITQGDTVVWTNNDGATHTVDSTDDAGTLDSGNIAMGETFSFTFDDAGTFPYQCDIHPSMTAEIVVESLAAV